MGEAECELSRRRIRRMAYRRRWPHSATQTKKDPTGVRSGLCGFTEIADYAAGFTGSMPARSLASNSSTRLCVALATLARSSK